MDTPLELTTDGRNLIISPVKDARRERRGAKALEHVNRRHAQTLKALAEEHRWLSQIFSPSPRSSTSMQIKSTAMEAHSESGTSDC